VGKAAWELSEPPVAIGRGLLVTTGAIGSVLGVAVLWLLSPMSGSAPTASPTATSSVAVVRTTEVGPATSDQRIEGTSSVAARPLDTIDLSQFTLPAEDVPSTVLLAAPRPQAHASIAVAIGDLPYILTTATAVSVDEQRTTVDIVAPGDPVSADVVSVDGGLAYLEPSSAVEVVSFAEVSSAEPGQTVVVLSDEPTEVTYRADGSAPELDPDVIVEGTPVIDDDGSLVALCTVVIDADGAWVGLVPVAAPPDAGTDGSTSSEPVTSDSVPIDATSSTDPTSTDPTSTVSSTPAPSTTVAPTSSAAANASTSSSTASGATSSSAAGSSTVPTAPAGATAWAGLRFDTNAAVPLVVSALPAGSPAGAAGIAVGDRVTAIDGVAVATIDDLQAQLRKHVPGDVVVFKVVPASPTTSAQSSSSTVAGSGTASGAGQAERSVSVTLGGVAPSV
jgi:S1-C subfamily serine protease